MLRRHRKKLIALAVLLLLPLLIHVGIGLVTRMSPPAVAAVEGERSERDGVRRVGRGYARKRGGILEVRLVGTPEEIGHQHARLLYEEMIASEGQLYTSLEQIGPFAPLRWIIFDVARVLHHGADRTMSDARLREIASQARAFTPDPFEGTFPTYQRFVYLNSLYDIALGFEHSPLLGCTSFAARGEAVAGGHTILARNFDFEAGSVYDEKKVVFLVREDGKIPFASVAWPGLVGVLSGMNARGLSIVVHGGRARDTRALGEPVVQTTRAILSDAATVDGAVELLGSREPMVSHILLLADATGALAVVERAPGEPPHVRRAEGAVLPVTNHFEGPLADDPKNRRVREVTSTVPRRERLDELLGARKAPLDPLGAISLLRDRRGPGDVELPLGHRSALDALIATHAVVMDSTDKVLWVSEGPHLLGRFVKFDLTALLAADHEPVPDEVVTLPADPALDDGTYRRWLESGSPHQGAM